MARSVTLALRHALTSLTLLLCLFNVPIWAAPATANAVCQATPKSSAPAGSHWYYRVDRSSQRKCWYLAAQGQTVRRAVSRVTSRTQKVANVAPFPTTDPIVMKPPSEFKPTDEAYWLVEQASLTASTLDAQTLNPPVAPTALPASGAMPPQQDNAEETPQSDSRLEELIEPLVSGDQTVSAPARERMSTIKFGLLALALTSLLASLTLYIVGLIGVGRPAPILDLNRKAPLQKRATPGWLQSSRSPERKREHSARELLTPGAKQQAA
jgi:hypothetical protein